jgi:hypothetical protein
MTEREYRDARMKGFVDAAIAIYALFCVVVVLSAVGVISK